MPADFCCDHCGAPALTTWERPTDWARLDFCGHCTNTNRDALRMAGFILKLDKRQTEPA